MTTLGKRVIDDAERLLIRARQHSFIDASVSVGVHLNDLEFTIQRYRGIEQALIENKHELEMLHATRDAEGAR